MITIDDKFFETVLSVVSRFGMRRTTMADLADNLDISRQTLYERFGDKDGVMAEAIAYMCQQTCLKLETGIKNSKHLDDCIDVYFDVVVYPSFETLQVLPEAADLERGFGPKSVASSQSFKKLKQEILTNMLSPYLNSDPADVAVFFETSSCRAYSSEASLKDLEKYLSVLKRSILGMVKPN